MCRMSRKNIFHISRVERNICLPMTKTALGVHSTDPFSEILPLDLVLLGVFAFCFKHKRLAVIQADKKIRAIFSDDPSVYVHDFEAEVIVLDPCRDRRIVVKLGSLACLPRAVVNAEV